MDLLLPLNSISLRRLPSTPPVTSMLPIPLIIVSE